MLNQQSEEILSKQHGEWNGSFQFTLRGSVELYWILEVPSKPRPQLQWVHSRCVGSIRTCHEGGEPYEGEH